MCSGFAVFTAHAVSSRTPLLQRCAVLHLLGCPVTFRHFEPCLYSCAFEQAAALGLTNAWALALLRAGPAAH